MSGGLITLVEDTSKAAFAELHATGAFITMKDRVYDALRVLGEATDEDLVNHTGLRINQVTGRRNDLMAEGLVDCVGKTTNNGRMVNVWGIVLHPVARKPQKFKCACCHGKGYLKTPQMTIGGWC